MKKVDMYLVPSAKCQVRPSLALGTGHSALSKLT